MKRLTACFSLLVLFLQAGAQNVIVSRYVPGNYLINNTHRVDLFNPSNYPRDISGYLLLTRNYSVRLPQGSVIPPRTVFSLARYAVKGQNTNVLLSRTPDFLIRFPDPGLPGNFVLLLDKRLNPVDGMYFSPSPRVDFLPDAGYIITSRRDSVFFKVPAEREKFWNNRSVNIGDDPAIGFFQVAGKWIPGAAKGNFLPATSYSNTKISWFDGIVSLAFSTDFEEGCYMHEIERSSDGEHFTPVGKVDAKGISVRKVDYQFYDPGTLRGQRYFYRVVNRDIYGNEIFSQRLEVLAGEAGEDFFLDVFPGKQGFSSEVNIRFRSATDKQVSIRLMRKDFRDEGLLFSGLAQADRQNLVKVSRALEPGLYLVVAQAGQNRYFKELVVAQ